MNFSNLFVLLAFFAYMQVAYASPYSTFAGPAFEPPSTARSLSNSKLRDAMRVVQISMHNVLATGNTTGQQFEPSSTSASVLVRSIYDDTPLLDFAYASAATPNTTITSDTIFRIGSVSKVYTVYALLLQGGFRHFEDLVVDHVPELHQWAYGHVGYPGGVAWNEITLGALAGQVAGIARDYNLADLSTVGIDWVALGLPPLNASEVPTCASSETDRPCSREEFFAGFLTLPSVFPAFATPAYSNAAFRILAYAIASITQKPYEQILHDAVTCPLNLTSTSLEAPANKSAAIVQGDHSWYQNLGDEAPTGGMYSSASDLSNFAAAILTNKQLSPPTVRRWLKPTSFTASMDLSIGMPWEIHRVALPQPGHRLVDLYAKSGSIGTYASELILVPDYGVSIVVLTAGKSGSMVDVLTNLVVDALLPQLEDAAKMQAVRTFGGNYTDATGLAYSLKISSDDGPGLVIERWTANGSDLLAAAAAYANATGGGHLVSLRLYPSERCTPTECGFRAVFEKEGLGQDSGVFRSNDGAWASVDSLVYGHGAVDRFVFSKDACGNVTGVWNDALRRTLAKV